MVVRALEVGFGFGGVMTSTMSGVAVRIVRARRKVGTGGKVGILVD